MAGPPRSPTWQRRPHAPARRDAVSPPWHGASVPEPSSRNRRARRARECRTALAFRPGHSRSCRVSPAAGRHVLPLYNFAVPSLAENRGVDAPEGIERGRDGAVDIAILEGRPGNADPSGLGRDLGASAARHEDKAIPHAGQRPRRGRAEAAAGPRYNRDGYGAWSIVSPFRAGDPLCPAYHDGRKSAACPRPCPNRHAASAARPLRNGPARRGIGRRRRFV